MERRARKDGGRSGRAAGYCHMKGRVCFSVFQRHISERDQFEEDGHTHTQILTVDSSGDAGESLRGERHQTR